MIFCFVFLETFLVSSILCSNGKKLDGYEFPVYSTEVCPRNQTEWNARSSAINCTSNNGYMCIPNRELTKLLEFCNIHRFIWIEIFVCIWSNAYQKLIHITAVVFVLGVQLKPLYSVNCSNTQIVHLLEMDVFWPNHLVQVKQQQQQFTYRALQTL